MINIAQLPLLIAVSQGSSKIQQYAQNHHHRTHRMKAVALQAATTANQYDQVTENSMEALRSAVDKLANSIRLYAEASTGFKRLFLADKEEAINNLDRAFDAKLESFHSVYDITKDEDYINYFSHADTALMIVLRNAIHHRNHLLFRSWNFEIHLNAGMRKMSGATFLLVNHELVRDGRQSQYYYKLEDFYKRLADSRMSKRKEKLLNLFNSELQFEKISEQATVEKCPISQVYINVIPIFISATSRLFRRLREEGIELKGFDSEVYSEHFSFNELVNLDKPMYRALTLPEVHIQI